jgi:type IV pilus assembly protein PilV
MSVRKAEAGFSLVEVLVAMLIISIGVLGIVALQSLALRNTGSSMERSQAVIQTYSYLEILRANRDEAIISALDIKPMTCDPLNRPETEVIQRNWLEQLHETLGPGACGFVDCRGGGQCTIIVQWNDTRAEGGSEAQQLITETIL